MDFVYQSVIDRLKFHCTAVSANFITETDTLILILGGNSSGFLIMQLISDCRIQWWLFYVIFFSVASKSGYIQLMGGGLEREDLFTYWHPKLRNVVPTEACLVHRL